MEPGDNRLRAALARIETADRALAEELRGVRERLLAPVGSHRLESLPAAGVASRSLETIVLRTGRPVLAIVQDQARLEFSDASSEVWRTRLTGRQTTFGGGAGGRAHRRHGSYPAAVGGNRVDRRARDGRHQSTRCQGIRPPLRQSIRLPPRCGRRDDGRIGRLPV